MKKLVSAILLLSIAFFSYGALYPNEYMSKIGSKYYVYQISYLFIELDGYYLENEHYEACEDLKFYSFISSFSHTVPYVAPDQSYSSLRVNSVSDRLIVMRGRDYSDSRIETIMKTAARFNSVLYETCN